MIPESEIRRIAGDQGLDPRIVDLDYVLSWALWGLFSRKKVRPAWAFKGGKGGTCLRKCYFPGYRFSVDLDFTALDRVGIAAFREGIENGLHAAADRSGIEFSAAPLRVREVTDATGSETLVADAYYRGPLRVGGSPAALRVQVALDEPLLFDPPLRRAVHGYSDAPAFGRVTVPCYAVEEIMAEKIRALAGQRIYAVSRDLFDLHELLRQPFDFEALRTALPRKFKARGLSFGKSSIAALRRRKDEYSADWERNLLRLLPAQAGASFEPVWDEVTGFLQSISSERK